jgi:alpha-L-rhamnosidase
MRELIGIDPFTDKSKDEYHFERSPWPATWIGHPSNSGQSPVVLAFRRHFAMVTTADIKLHVSADQRYELFLDGIRIGQGPERGDLENWFYETYSPRLLAGRHMLVVRVTWLGTDAALAQVSARPALLLLAEGLFEDVLSTGVAPWETKKLGGYSFSPPVASGWTGVGARTGIDGRQFDWGYELGDGEGWLPVSTLGPAAIKSVAGEAVTPWKLRPAALPAMRGRFAARSNSSAHHRRNFSGCVAGGAGGCCTASAR